MRGDQPGADQREIAAQYLGGVNVAAVGNRPGQPQGAVPELAHFGDEGERVVAAGMPARAVAHQHQAIDAGGHRLACEGRADDVGDHHAAIGVHGFKHALGAAQGRGHDGRLITTHQVKLGLEAVIGAVHDHVEHPWRPLLATLPGQVTLAGDLLQPLLQLLDRARIGRGQAADDAGLATGGHKVRPRHQEHRCREYREVEPGKQVQELLLRCTQACSCHHACLLF